MNTCEIKILVAEDDDRLRRQYEHVLREAGYSVESVASGERAIELLSKTTYDLILTDIEMNGKMSGVQIAGRRYITYPKTKIIVITGMVGLTKSAVGRDGFPGCDVTLFKPVDVEMLLSTVRDVLAR